MSVVALFGALKGLFKKNDKCADTSNYLLTFSRTLGIMLVFFSILTTSKQFFGDPILCSKSAGAWSANMFNNYCFMTGTSSLKHMRRTEVLMPGEAHSGIATDSYKEEKTKVYHSYYQWIPFILFIQGVLFYIPYRVWKNIVGERVTKLIAKVSKDPLCETSIDEQVEGLGRFIAANPMYFNHFARKRFFVDLSVLLLAILQMYLLDWVFDGQYFQLGYSFYRWKNAWSQYLIIVDEMFPLVTSCTASFINTGGTITPDSGNCVMSINILNQKIFVISWLLHVALVAAAVLVLIWSLLLSVTPIIRFAMLRSRVSAVHTHMLRRVDTSCSYGQYVLLIILSQNMESVQFDALIEQIASHLDRLRGGDEESASEFSSDNVMSRLHRNYGGKKCLGKDNNNLLANMQQDSCSETPTLDCRMRVPVYPKGDLPRYNPAE